MRRNRNKPRQNPADNPILYATIESLDQEGRGVTHVDGKTIFIDGALPNERISYQSQRIKPSYEVANVVEVLQGSDERVAPKCPHFGLCGGCKLQHMDATAQVAAKQQMLEADLWHIGKVKAESMLPPLYGPTWGYRHKARLSVKYVQKKERVLVGFNEKGTRFVADMNSCEVLVPEVSALIAPLQSMIFELSIRDKLPQIELAVGEDSVIVLILRIMDVMTENDETRLKAFADAHQVQIWTQTKGPDTIKPFWPLNGEQLQYSLPEFNLTYPFKPNEFTQVNPQINQQMVHSAIQLLQPKLGEKIADFFCGIGNFTLPIARRGASVLGLEGLTNLVDRANESAALNKLSQVQFGVADLFKMTEESLLALGKFDKWLIDPPRDGSFELVKAITEAAAPKLIVYVSCNPATLARDAGVLVNEKGYILKTAGVINMFPHTAHIESIALFEYAGKLNISAS
ncbi:MAG: 23S rRNA (uracil(1939)-C(5))-methyltransferase RlmD [Bdellovibrio sp.]|nr:23S rRNA (uracil(1939)-C(5))-methyltransferase RlmD [Methylotenera sp.]